MDKLKTLYKLDSKGKIRQWDVIVDGSDVVVISGLKEGKKVESRYTAKPKNVGRSNETSAEEQAKLEAKALWTKQKDRKQYTETPEEQKIKDKLPMKARDYKKVGHQVNWFERKYIAQPKLNGLRALVDRDGNIWSKTRKLYSNNYLISGLVKDIFEKLPEEIEYLDGELYLHGMSLQQINSAVKKRRDTSDNIQFHVYDVIDKDLKLTFEERINILTDKLGKLKDVTEIVQLVEQYPKPITEETLGEVNKTYVASGYEGAILRDVLGTYEPDKRSKYVFKYKTYQDDEFKITRVEEDKLGRGLFGCVTKEGNYFKVRPTGEDSYREYIIKNPEEFIGKWLNVKFFDYSDDNIPEQPVGMYIRDCDENGDPTD